MSRIQSRLSELGLTLPPAPRPAGSYVPTRTEKTYVITSGMLPLADGKVVHPGRLGAELDVEAGRAAAAQALLNALAAVAEAAGDLDRLTGVLRLDGWVAGDPAFTEQHLVMNAASDLLVDLFGEAGRHTRTAVGVASLPMNAAVELALVVEL